MVIIDKLRDSTIGGIRETEVSGYSDFAGWYLWFNDDLYIHNWKPIS